MHRWKIAAVLLALWPARAWSESPAGTDIPRWQPHDFSFISHTTSPNPFQVALSADLVGPGGRKLTVPGFYDGDGTWKIRVSPTDLGAWSLVTHSSAAALNNQHATFTCTANSLPQVHGGLRVDHDYPHQFVFEDGSHVFPMGYECDWLWALTAAILISKRSIPSSRSSRDWVSTSSFSTRTPRTRAGAKAHSG